MESKKKEKHSKTKFEVRMYPPPHPPTSVNRSFFPERALHDVRLLPDAVVVLHEPLKRRLVWVKLGLEFWRTRRI
jgi:hypothetical protein